MTKARKILTLCVFAVILGGGFVVRLILKPPARIDSENRPANSLPEVNISNIASGRLMDKFEDWASDSFPMRETLRTVRADTVFHIFMQSDKSGLFFGDTGADKIIPIDESAYIKSAKHINSAYDMLFHDMNSYFTVVPDKSMYCGHYTPGYDPNKSAEILKRELNSEIQFFDISGVLNADMFYKTDLHWDQLALEPLLERLGEEISGGKWTPPDNVQYFSAGLFTGAYSGQLALRTAPDEVKTVSLPAEITAAYYVQTADGEWGFINGPIYDYGYDDGYDYRRLYGVSGTHGFLSSEQYSLFLCGSPQPLIVLNNAANSGSGKNLYIVRDSFASSLAPLIALTSDYETVTLIDFRGITTGQLRLAIELVPGSDVLFLLSSQILNAPSTLDRVEIQ